MIFKLLMCVLSSLYASFAPAGAPALAGLGHPDVASGRYSGTALACATKNPFIASPRVGTQTPLRNLHRTRLLTRIFRRAACGTSPQYSPSPFPHTLPKPRARGSFPAAQPRPTSHHKEGEREVGERPVCSVATSGCPKRSEDGFPAGARNIPPLPAQPNSK